MRVSNSFNQDVFCIINPHQTCLRLLLRLSSLEHLYQANQLL